MVPQSVARQTNSINLNPSKIIIIIISYARKCTFKAGLLELLRVSEGVQFVIPAYQRNYTWTANKEVRQLLEDVKSVLTGKRNKHFVGIIIYLEKSFSAFRRERLVIDGQQRLTTIFLTLYAIKELMTAQGLTQEGMYLINRYDETNRFKLKPLVSDDTVYKHIVDGDFDAIDEKESKVWLNYLYIKKCIQELLSNYSFDNILEALNKMYIVGVPIAESDYPQKVFESINATGAKLTASDLIRNFILMPIESTKQDHFYDRYWKRIETLIDNDSKKLEAFFRFFLMAKRQTAINKSAVYYAFTEWFENNVGQMTVEDIFKEIVDYADSFNLIYRADLNKLDAVLRPSIEEFRFILSEMPAPLMLELFQLNKHGKLATQPMSEVITILNSYLMRRQLCDLDTSSISRYFPTLLKETMADCDGGYANIVEIFKKNLVNRNKGNSQEMPDYSTPQSQTSTPMLLRQQKLPFSPARQTTDNASLSPFLGRNGRGSMPQPFLRQQRKVSPSSFSWVRQSYECFLKRHPFLGLFFIHAAFLYLSIGIWWAMP